MNSGRKAEQKRGAWTSRPADGELVISRQERTCDRQPSASPNFCPSNLLHAANRETSSATVHTAKTLTMIVDCTITFMARSITKSTRRCFGREARRQRDHRPSHRRCRPLWSHHGSHHRAKIKSWSLQNQHCGLKRVETMVSFLDVCADEVGYHYGAHLLRSQPDTKLHMSSRILARILWILKEFAYVVGLVTAS